jgi:hypothetical protein
VPLAFLNGRARRFEWTDVFDITSSGHRGVKWQLQFSELHVVTGSLLS